MKVTLLQITPLSVAYVAGKACVADRVTLGKTPWGEEEDYLQRLIDMGHESVLEHIVFTFDLDGFSRATLQELARHRIASLSVESTRWAMKKTIQDPDNLIIGSAVGRDEYMFQRNRPSVQNALHATAVLMKRIKELSQDEVVPNDLLKLFLPESYKTRAIFPINARSLRNLFKLRTDNRAFWEFQDLCKEMHEALPPHYHFLFTDVMKGES